MTRREQLIINDYCEREISIVSAELVKVLSVRRLRKSNAHVYETANYYLLKSYATFA